MKKIPSTLIVVYRNGEVRHSEAARKQWTISISFLVSSNGKLVEYLGTICSVQRRSETIIPELLSDKMSMPIDIDACAEISKDKRK